MKLVKIDKKVSPQKYFYECIECGKKNIARQDKHYKTDYCHACMLKNRLPRENTGKYGIKANDKNYFKKVHRIRMGKRRAVERECDTCGVKYNSTSEYDVNTCTTCAKLNRGKTISNTSGYVGVGYINPTVSKNGTMQQGHWYGRMVLHKKVIFSVRYKDSYAGSDEYKKLKCAIDREIHIIENGLNHHRNFTNEEIRGYVENGIGFK